MVTGQVEKSRLKQKYLYKFKVEKYQPSLIIQVYLYTSTVEKEYIWRVVCSTLRHLLLLHSSYLYNRITACGTGRDLYRYASDVHPHAIYCMSIC